MFECENKVAEYDMHRLEVEMRDVKKKYFKEKKRRHNMREAKAISRVLPSIVPGREQFTGGGFKVSVKQTTKV